MLSAAQPDNPWFSWEYSRSAPPRTSSPRSVSTSLTVQAVLIASLVALPLGAWAYVRRRWAGPVLGVAGVLYTIPSLALFAVLAPYTGIGRTTVLIGLVAYALLVLTRNVVVGLEGVDSAVRDAARGMGYGRARLLLTVEPAERAAEHRRGAAACDRDDRRPVTVGVVVGYGGLGQT